MSDPIPLDDVAIVMPALNEATALRHVLPLIAAWRPAQIVIADNGSTDETAAVARHAGATVACEPHRGYGAACWAGIKALSPEIPIIVFMDADAADDPGRIGDLVRPIRQDRADFVIGCRAGILCEPGALLPQQRFGNWLATTLIRLRWGYAYRDLGPFRAIRRDALLAMRMRDRAFGWTVEMQVRALRMGLRIEQIDVAYRRRIGRSKIAGTLRGSIRAGYWILTTLGRLGLERRGRQSDR